MTRIYAILHTYCIACYVPCYIAHHVVFKTSLRWAQGATVSYSLLMLYSIACYIAYIAYIACQIAYVLCNMLIGDTVYHAA